MRLSIDSYIYRRYHAFYIAILSILIFSISIIVLIQILHISFASKGNDPRILLSRPSTWSEVIVNTQHREVKTATNHSCHYYNCFNVYRCGRSGHQKLSVYVYPLVRYLDEDRVEIKPISKEYLEILKTIINSEYFVTNYEEACLFVPPIDTLNENDLRKEKISEILTILPQWSSGENHLLFNFLPGTPPDFYSSLGIERGKALVAGAGFSSLTYRLSYDVSIPVYNPLYRDTPQCRNSIKNRKWLIVSSQVNIHRDYREDLEEQVVSSSNQLLVLNACNPVANLTQRCRGDVVYPYPQILHSAKFCLIIRGGRLGQTSLHDALKAGCIPIIVADGYILPFSEVLDWRKASILLYEEELPDLVKIIKKFVDEKRMEEMQQQVMWLYKTYFSTIKDITMTTLKILNDRIFPAHAISKQQWNDRPNWSAVSNPLFLPITAPAEEGFTAVILTYDRLNSLFEVIQNLAKAQSLTKILIIWNNQKKKPPPFSRWPKVDVPLKVIQTRKNKMSNRFYPYEEIQTECILALDDDINMMTADELEFGYHVWREFPDRIVGFPSRNVIWNNTTQSWKYDSEWTNEVSMVLTGVAFYHKYWSFVYTTDMPGDIKDWVDFYMNCEDIAMNFLVANRTGKAPIKVAPRKKFKCSDCTSGDISANEAHLTERSHCVNYFSKVFGTMPLKTVEFRADPVLFKEKVHRKLQLYNDIGSL